MAVRRDPQGLDGQHNKKSLKTPPVFCVSLVILRFSSKPAWFPDHDSIYLLFQKVFHLIRTRRIRLNEGLWVYTIADSVVYPFFVRSRTNARSTIAFIWATMPGFLTARVRSTL